MAAISSGAYLAHYIQNKKARLIRPIITQNFNYNPTLGDNLESIASKIEQEFKDEKIKEKLKEKTLGAFFSLYSHDYDSFLRYLADDVYVAEGDRHLSPEQIVNEFISSDRKCAPFQFNTKEDIVQKAKDFRVLSYDDLKKESGFRENDPTAAMLKDNGFIGVLTVDTGPPCHLEGIAAIYKLVNNEWKIVALPF